MAAELTYDLTLPLRSDWCLLHGETSCDCRPRIEDAAELQAYFHDFEGLADMTELDWLVYLRESEINE